MKGTRLPPFLCLHSLVLRVGTNWSSYRDNAGLRLEIPQWLCLDWLRYWVNSPDTARAKYRR